MESFEVISSEEMLAIDGGKLQTTSDWLLLGGSICMCFVAPQVGLPMAIATAIWS